MMASCEARLLKAKTISWPFMAKEIAEGALQDHLTQEDYDTPLKVNILTFRLFQDSLASACYYYLSWPSLMLLP